MQPLEILYCLFIASCAVNMWFFIAFRKECSRHFNVQPTAIINAIESVAETVDTCQSDVARRLAAVEVRLIAMALEEESPKRRPPRTPAQKAARRESERKRRQQVVKPEAGVVVDQSPIRRRSPRVASSVDTLNKQP